MPETEGGTTQELLELLGSDSGDSVVSADSFGEPYDRSVGLMQRRVTAVCALAYTLTSEPFLKRSFYLCKSASAFRLQHKKSAGCGEKLAARVSV